MKCPFCHPDEDRVAHKGGEYCCLWDGFPVSEGHILVVPNRHFANWFEATKEEQLELLDGIEIARQTIQKEYDPDGFNIGIR